MWNIGCGFTSKCNMNCQFCYSKESRENGVTINFADAIAFLDLNNKMIGTINYGTGENSLSHEWFDFIVYVRERYPHISQSLTTNGYISQMIKKNTYYYNAFVSCIDEVDISVDFYEEQRHNSSRGHQCAFAWAMETLKLCGVLDKKVTIVFVSMDAVLEYDNLSGLIQLARNHGAYLRTNILRHTREIKQNISVNKLYNGFNYLFENTGIVSISDPLISAIYLGKKAQDNTGVRSVRILPDGYITPATYLISNEWKVKHISNVPNLNDFNELNEFKVFEKNVLPRACEKCRLRHICCGGTYDRRLLKFHSLEFKDPLCPFDDDGKLIVEGICGSDKINIFSDERIPNIHAAYLPTIIMK